jgi:hypothetical protein
MQRRVSEDGTVQIKSKIYTCKDTPLQKFVYQKVTIQSCNGIYEAYSYRNKYLGELVEVVAE